MTDLARDWIQVTFTAVNHSKYYTKGFFVLLWDCKWILILPEGFCPIRLIHLIERKFFHFETIILLNSVLTNNAIESISSSYMNSMLIQWIYISCQNEGY